MYNKHSIYNSTSTPIYTHTVDDHLVSAVFPNQVVVFTSLLRILTIMPITRLQGQDRHKNCHSVHVMTAPRLFIQSDQICWYKIHIFECKV